MLTKKFFKTKDQVEVTFEFDRPEAREAALYCEANGWEPVSMARSNKGKGPFKTKLALPRDTEVQFKYLVDGERWENDPDADDYRSNEYGGENSVVVTKNGN